MTHRVTAEYARVDNSASNIHVSIRARPPEDKSVNMDFIETTSTEEGSKILIKDPNSSTKKHGEVSYQFDNIFWTETSQEEVFQATCKVQVDHVLEGYNCCSFAYGQTGSGKTYSMFGQEADIRGLIPRSVEYIFKNLAQRTTMYEVAMVCSFLEIYNDQIRDLGKAYLVAMGVESSTSTALFAKTSDLFESLAVKRRNPNFAPAFQKGGYIDTEELARRPGLKEVSDQYNQMNYEIREDTEGNVFVKDLSLIPVSTIDEVMTLIAMGLKVRATHETKMNATSSRSHTVFTITILQKDKSTGQAFSGMLNLVDLAGSERIKKSESQGVRLREALHINTSLTALGKVITALDPSSESTHIPYRDSKLTRVLQNSLGGNSYTNVIAAIHPNPLYYEECLSTLQFANRCRNVRNTPKVNYVSENEDKDRKIRRLMDEIQQMRMKIGGDGVMGGGVGGGHGHAGKGEVPASKLVEILKKLGMRAELGSDGGLIVDGKPISAAALGLGLDEGSASDDTVFDAARIGSAAPGKKVSEKQRAQITDLQEQLKAAQESNRDRKEVIDKQANQIKKLTQDLVKYQTNLKHKEFQYDSLNLEKDRLLKDLEERLRKESDTKVKDILNHNQSLLTQQHNTLQRFPTALKDYTDLFKKLKEDDDRNNEPLMNEHRIQLQSMQTSLQDQMESLKQQYEHWLSQKDKTLENYVQKFNEYRQKKREQLNKCELEVVRLHDHVERVEAILVGFEKGEYPVVQKQGYHGRPTTGVILALDTDVNTLPNLTGGNPTSAKPSTSGFLGHTKAGSILIPKGLRPRNPLVPEKHGEVTLAKKIVMKYREQEEAHSKQNSKSIQQAQLLTSMGTLDPEIQKQIKDMLDVTAKVKTKVKAKVEQDESLLENSFSEANEFMASKLDDTYNASIRPFTGAGGGRQSAPAVLSGVQRSELVEAGNFGLPVNVDEIQSLRDEVARLRAENMKKKLDNEQVVKALSGDETVQYIRQLEAEINKLHKYIQDMAIQLKSAKVANASLSRQLDGKKYPPATDVFKGPTGISSVSLK